MGRNLSCARVITDESPNAVIAREPVPAEPQPTSSKKLHVLTLTPFYPVAGDDASGCFVAEVLPALEAYGVVNTVIAVQPFYRGRPRASASASRASWKRYLSLPGNLGLPSSGLFLFARILAAVRKLHSTHPIDLIQAHGALPCGHAAALLHRGLRIPYVVTVHGLDAYGDRQAPGFAGQWCKRISRIAYRSARAVIGVSEKVCEQLNIDAPVHTTVVYNGVDQELFSPGGESRTSPRILSVGNLIPIKGHELLLRAIAAVQDVCPDITCDVIGSGPELRRLQGLAVELGMRDKVQFLGRQGRRDVANAMRRCGIFALPSRYEGLGCVYLEAMSAGKPVIACRGQGIAEIVQHGVNGWLVGPSDVRELATALRSLLLDAELRRRLGSTARRTITQQFTLGHQAERLTRVYRECLA